MAKHCSTAEGWKAEKGWMKPTRCIFSLKGDKVCKGAGLNAKGYSERDEERILDALGHGLLKEFTNPDRVGCPGYDVLMAIC